VSREPTLSAAALHSRAREILDANWRPEGFTVPSSSAYPFQWLWDSCFHAIVWAHLGATERAITELSHVFRSQDEVGFVPHIDYEAEPSMHASFWGRVGQSTITQPPMFGHAIAELHRLDVAVPEPLVRHAAAGLHFLLDQRARDPETGLITIVHPWESGADNSPRWDHWSANAGGSFDRARWYDVKGELLRTVVRGPSGAPLANPAFGAAPASFNALVAFNARELCEVAADDSLLVETVDLEARLAARWHEDLTTWVDAGPAAATSGATRVLDALLPALVLPDRTAAALHAAVHDAQYGGDCGPAGVHRDEQTFAPRAYWRGAAWPQLTYLLWVAARHNGLDDIAQTLAADLVRGAERSGFAEYWDPDHGTALGAQPQSWATLAAVVATQRP
jgi:hypothetical protein